MNKPLIVQSLKGGAFSYVLSTVFLLALALVAKLFVIDVAVLPTVYRVLGLIAVCVATAFCISDGKLIAKATLIAIFFVILNLITYVLLGDGFSWLQIGIQLAVSLAGAIIVAVLKSARS